MANDDEFDIDIDLKNRNVAALLAWLVPGVGHLYQGRTSKGILIFVTISLLFISGLQMSGGKAVYCSFRSPDLRWQFVGQFFVGSASVPAIIQNRVVRGQQENPDVEVIRPLFGGKFSPPVNLVKRDERVNRDIRAEWHGDYHAYFQMGTLYTLVAGLLNLFAIFDAYCGPMALFGETTTEGDESEGEEP